MTSAKKQGIEYIAVPKELLPPKWLLANRGMIHAQEKGVGIGASLIRQGDYRENRVMRNYFNVECVGADGKIKWVDEFQNLVVTAGLDDSLDKHLKGSGYTAVWYVGLTDSAPTVAAGDTMASHVGWVLDQNYSEGVRQTLTLGSVSAGSVDNVASVAAFSINGTTTIGGAFVADDDTKGGATGILYGAGAFSGGDRGVIDGDTINVTVTLTAAAS